MHELSTCLWGLHSTKDLDYALWGKDMMQFHRRLSKFWTDMLPPSSRNETEIEVVVTSRTSIITFNTAHCCNLEEATLLTMYNNMPVLVTCECIPVQCDILEISIVLLLFDQTLYFCMQWGTSLMSVKASIIEYNTDKELHHTMKLSYTTHTFLCFTWQKINYTSSVQIKC